MDCQSWWGAIGMEGYSEDCPSFTAFTMLTQQAQILIPVIQLKLLNFNNVFKSKACVSSNWYKISLDLSTYSKDPIASFSQGKWENVPARQGPDSWGIWEKRMNIADPGLYFSSTIVLNLPKIEAQGHSALFKGVLDFQAEQDHSRI